MSEVPQYQLLLNSFVLLKPVHKRVFREFCNDLFGSHPELKSLIPEMKEYQLINKIYDLLFKVVESSAGHYQDMSYFNKLGANCTKYQISIDTLIDITSKLMTAIKNGLGSKWTDEMENVWFVALDKVIHEFYCGMIDAEPECKEKAG